MHLGRCSPARAKKPRSEEHIRTRTRPSTVRSFFPISVHHLAVATPSRKSNSQLNDREQHSALALRSQQPSLCARGSPRRAVAAALAVRSLCARNSTSRSSGRRQPPENLTVRSFFDQGRLRLLRPRNRHRWIALS